ncbi:MAG: TIGR00296 family protein [Methanomassiliicoccaceae archaeon]|nr:TIGR00296 family protein [Methanomassiliicoccaceae archaeon]
MMNAEDGIEAVRIARSVIEERVTHRGAIRDIPASFDEPSGVFVTINTYPSLHLRGCIGYPGPAFPLADALVNAATHACNDPRFCELEEYELNDIVVEVTILTPPEPIAVNKKEDLLTAIRIGKDGLMLEYKGRSSVFLPQVPREWNWDVLEYLENLCKKAGLNKDTWKEKDCRILSFEGRIFKETSPYGDIAEVDE